LKDYKFLAKFGKKGEGPREFRVRPNGKVRIHPRGKYIYVDSIGKVSKWTRDGKFVKETKATSGRRLMPLGHDRFVGMGAAVNEGKKRYFFINLYDSELKQIKSLSKQLNMNQGDGLYVYYNSIEVKTYDKKIFLSGYDDFKIDVYDNNGKKRFTINHDYKRKKVSHQDKKDVISWYKQDPRYDDRAVQYYKENVKYAEYFPAIEKLTVKDDKIYAR
ncbi:MAG: hypothetical protein GY757_48280, partial [bacterium]|nr:hypothetical protein [bacterium]